MNERRHTQNNSDKTYSMKVFVKHMCAIFSILLAFDAQTLSQPSFTALGEIKVSQTPVDNSPPSVAVNKDGATWVTWRKSVQWFHSNLSFDGANNSDFKTILIPFSSHQSGWQCLMYRDSMYFIGGPRLDINHKIFSIDQKRITDSSLTLYSTGGWTSYTEPGEGGSSWVHTQYGYSNGVSCYLVHNDLSESEELGMHLLGAPREILLYNVTSRVTIDLLPISSWDWNLGQMYRHDIRFAKKYGIPILAVSSLRNNTFLAYSRSQRGNTITTSPDFYFRTVKMFNTNGDSLTRTILLDSIASPQCNASDRIAYGKNNDVFVLHQENDSGKMVCEQFDLSTSTLLAKKFLSMNVRRIPVVTSRSNFSLDTIPQLWKADYQIEPLLQGGFIMTWTELQSDSSSDVFIARYDNEMNLLGEKKRVSSTADSNQYHPSLTLRGNEVTIVWLDTRSGERHVFMRRFSADQISIVEQSSQFPTTLSLDLYPNPSLGSTTIRYRLSDAGWTSLRIVDVFGRTLRTLFDGEKEPGVHELRYDGREKRPGYYHLMLQRGSHFVTKPLLISY